MVDGVKLGDSFAWQCARHRGNLARESGIRSGNKNDVSFEAFVVEEYNEKGPFANESVDDNEFRNPYVEM